MNITHIWKHLESSPDMEIIERKGLGHPDTLCDALAEDFSRTYSNYTLQRFGAVLHHNFDKVGLLGGKSHVRFGAGTLTSPIRVLLNGRASEKLGDEVIPVREMLQERTKALLGSRFQLLDLEEDLEFHDNLSTGSSPGHVEIGNDLPADRKHWFNPRNLSDVRDRTQLNSNDTSVGCAHYPFSQTEQCVLDIEQILTSSDYQNPRPWLGSDIKVMACRIGSELDLTLCIPEIANFVQDMRSYRENLASCEQDISTWVKQRVPNMKVRISLNTKDNFELPELYLTAIGSSIESGDEGLVGRGNRPNGLISMCRPYSMEGACGKNPVYHAGKVYNVVAQRLAKQLYELNQSPTEVWIIGQEGRALKNPWKIVITHNGPNFSTLGTDEIVEKGLEDIHLCTEDLLKGNVRLY